MTPFILSLNRPGVAGRWQGCAAPGATGAKGKYRGKWRCSLSMHLALASCDEQGPPIASPRLCNKNPVGKHESIGTENIEGDVAEYLVYVNVVEQFRAS